MREIASVTIRLRMLPGLYPLGRSGRRERRRRSGAVQWCGIDSGSGAGEVMERLVLSAFVLNACGTQDRETNVPKLRLPTTEAACLAAGGDWNPPAPEKIVSGCHLRTTDGERSCTQSVQCQSHCVEHEDGNRCAAFVDGCFSETGRGTVRQCVN